LSVFQRVLSIVGLAVLPWLAGCAGDPVRPPPQPAPPLRPGAQWTQTRVAEQCVPYARRVSGIGLRGDAWTWWEQTGDGPGLQQTDQPKRGAVLVLRRGSRLSLGHLAVVVSVAGPRMAWVTHTNWGSDRATRRRIYGAMPVVDASADNDWTRVRMWNYDTGAWGGVYDAYGFIAAPGTVLSFNEYPAESAR
jgi:hypothetical protein